MFCNSHHKNESDSPFFDFMILRRYKSSQSKEGRQTFSRSRGKPPKLIYVPLSNKLFLLYRKRLWWIEVKLLTSKNTMNTLLQNQQFKWFLSTLACSANIEWLEISRLLQFVFCQQCSRTSAFALKLQEFWAEKMMPSN